MEGSAVLSRRGATRSRRASFRAPFVQRYWAFLSYSHADAADAAWLHAALEKFRVPPELVGRRTERFLVPKSLSPIFRDRSELAASRDLSQEIREAIECSRHLLVLCSPAAARSKWVDEEIRTFKQLRPDGEVLAAILSGVPHASSLPGREAEECFPPALRERFDARGRPTGEPAEPIAADLREEADGRQGGLIKLVAGMLDLRLDDLVQREDQRRNRKHAIVTAASIAGMALTSTLAVTAIQARDAARDQRREAESLVGFMIGDLKDKLEPVGRLDALDAVGGRVLAYYQRQDKGALSDEALAQRSKALTLMGDIAQRRGDLDGALRRYREGLAGTAEALRRDPDNPQRLFDHAQNVFHVGNLADRKGQLGEAEKAYKDYKRLADRMVALEPGNTKWQIEAQSASANLGIILFKSRRYPEASQEFAKALWSAERLTARDPNNSETQANRLTTLAWLADAKLGEGRLLEATELRRRQLGLIMNAPASDENNAVYRREEIPARRALGRLLSAQGDHAGGIRQLERATAVGERLLSIEPDNLEWVEVAAAAQLELGGALLASQRLSEAAEQIGRGCANVDRLATSGNMLTDWQLLRVDCFGKRARLALAAGRSGEALVASGQALAAAEAHKGADPVDGRIAIATMKLLTGDILQRSDSGAAARAEWSAALATWPRIAENPRQMAIRAELLTRLGRTHEAQALTARLQTMGFRRLV